LGRHGADYPRGRGVGRALVPARYCGGGEEVMSEIPEDVVRAMCTIVQETINRRIDESVRACSDSAAEVIQEQVRRIELELAGKDARIDQLETHVHNLERLILERGA